MQQGSQPDQPNCPWSPDHWMAAILDFKKGCRLTADEIARMIFTSMLWEVARTKPRAAAALVTCHILEVVSKESKELVGAYNLGRARLPADIRAGFYSCV